MADQLSLLGTTSPAGATALGLLAGYMVTATTMEGINAAVWRHQHPRRAGNPYNPNRFDEAWARAQLRLAGHENPSRAVVEAMTTNN